MSKFDEAIEAYKAEMSKIGVSVNDALLTGITKSLGPVIYNADSALVSSSDQAELDRVKNNFLIKKLGLADGPELDTAIQEVIEKFGSSNRNKHRAVFYYLLAQKFSKEAIFID